MRRKSDQLATKSRGLPRKSDFEKDYRKVQMKTKRKLKYVTLFQSRRRPRHTLESGLNKNV